MIKQPKKSFFHWFRWVLLSFGIVIVAGAIIIFGFTPISLLPLNVDNPPKFIQADFVELNKIFAISKFRSGVGHDFSVHSGETCRSMKHYFGAMDPDQPNYKQQGLKEGEWPHPVEGKDVTIFSPVDGKVANIYHDEKRGWTGDEMGVIAKAQPKIIIRLMHVTPLEGIKAGTKVSAGQPIGLVLANQSFDIVLESDGLIKTAYISYFAAMSDEIFAKYQARGIKSRDELIFTKEYIDANPWKCAGGKERFAENYIGTPEGEALNMVHLSGYEEVSEKINPRENKDNLKK